MDSIRKKKVSKRNQQRFLEALRTNGGIVLRAAESCDLHTSNLYVERREDPEFAYQWQQAIDESTISLEDKAIERAMEYSDTLLIFLLKARKPDTYRDNAKQSVDLDRMLQGFQFIQGAIQDGHSQADQSGSQPGEQSGNPL